MIEDIVSEYISYLQRLKPIYQKRFTKLLNSNIEAARAEACTFKIMKENFGVVAIHEDPSSGGLDFLVEVEGEKVLAEATSLSVEAVEKASGLSNSPLPRAGSFNPIVSMVFNRVREKTPQLAENLYPRVLVITTEHAFSATLFNWFLVNQLMVGRVYLSLELEGTSSPELLSTNLKQSIFIKFDGNQTAPCRQSVSGVLLVGLHTKGYLPVLLEHPTPAKKLPQTFGERFCTYSLAASPEKQILDLNVVGPNLWKWYSFENQDT